MITDDGDELQCNTRTASNGEPLSRCDTRGADQHESWIAPKYERAVELWSSPKQQQQQRKYDGPEHCDGLRDVLLIMKRRLSDPEGVPRERHVMLLTGIQVLQLLHRRNGLPGPSDTRMPFSSFPRPLLSLLRRVFERARVTGVTSSRPILLLLEEEDEREGILLRRVLALSLTHT